MAGLALNTYGAYFSALMLTDKSTACGWGPGWQCLQEWCVCSSAEIVSAPGLSLMYCTHSVTKRVFVFVFFK